MRLTTFVSDQDQLTNAKKHFIEEVLLEPKTLAIQGKLSAPEVQNLARAAREMGMRPVLVWDALHLDAELTVAERFLKSLDLSLFAAVRVQDPGAIEILLELAEAPRIQLLLKTGNHNAVAILAWIEQCRGRVERVVLSSELPKIRIEEYVRVLPVGVEVLGMGPPLLFYSPRKLLSYALPKEDSVDLEMEAATLAASADCEDTHHKGFRIIETPRGTLMYHAKDYCLLAQSTELRQIGLESFLIDLRLSDANKWLGVISELAQNWEESKAEQFLAEYPVKTTYCFYAANATDVLFKKLKNRQTQRRDVAYVGEVVESLKGQHLLIQLQGKSGGIKAGEKFSVVNPFGKTLVIEAWEIKNLNGEKVSGIDAGDFAVLPYFSEIAPTSTVYRSLV